MALEQLQTQYQSNQLQLLTLEKLKKNKLSLEMQIEHAKQDILQYEQALGDTRKVLNKMERFSFVNAVRTWTGKQQELFEQRYDEMAKVELKLVEAQLMLEDLNDHLMDAIYKINAINEPYTRAQMVSLEQEIEKYLLANCPGTAEVLQDYVKQLTLIEQLLIEIDEAIAAGKDAEGTLISAKKVMSDANMYSTWDTFLGGGFIATALKHDSLDKSNSYVHAAQFALQRFQNELLDIQEMKANTLQIDIDGFVKFADYFIDDIFSEWSIHSKIATSMTQIERVLNDVRNTLLAVEQKRQIALDKKTYLRQKHSEMLATNEQIL